MARITREQAESMSPSSSSWFSLKNDKDTAKIQFFYTHVDDIEHVSCHKIPIEEGSYASYNVDCLRDLEDSIDDCPLCAGGDSKWQAKGQAILQFYNHDTGRMEFWERGKQFIEKLEAMIDTYGAEDFPYTVFQVQRLGAKGDKQTKYELMALPRADAIDWNEIEIPDLVSTDMGAAVRVRTADEMDYFIENGQWPDNDDRPARPARRPEAQRRSAPAPRGGSRTAPEPPTGATRRSGGTGTRGGRPQPRGRNEDF